MSSFTLFPPPPRKKPDNISLKAMRTQSPVPTEEVVMHVSSGRTSFETRPDGRSTPSLAPSTAATSVITSLKRSNSSSSIKKGPIRSIFPEYDHSVSLQNQRYYPQASPLSAQFSGQISPLQGQISPGFPPSIAPTEHQHIQPSSAPAHVSSFPADLMRSVQPTFSSEDELQLLWEAANGQGEEDDGRMFSLKMTRNGAIDPNTGVFRPSPTESFRFGATRSHTFYEFETMREDEHDANHKEIVVRRQDPGRGSVLTVMTLNLESSDRRNPPGDGLIALIYPKAAAMMAVDKTVESIRKGKMPARDAAAITEEAVRKAGERECCKLVWDSEKERYLLHHPGLKDGKGQSFSAHIEGLVGFDMPGARGTVKINNLDNQQTVAALEFATATLVINTAATIPLKSFYMVDNIVTTLMVIGVVEGRLNRLKRPPPQQRIVQHRMSYGPLSPTMSVIPGSPLSVIPGSPRSYMSLASPVYSPLNSPLQSPLGPVSPLASPTFRPRAQVVSPPSAPSVPVLQRPSPPLQQGSFQSGPIPQAAPPPPAVEPQFRAPMQVAPQPSPLDSQQSLEKQKSPGCFSALFSACFGRK